MCYFYSILVSRVEFRSQQINHLTCVYLLAFLTSDCGQTQLSLVHTAQLCLVSFRQTKSASGRCWSVFISPRLFSLVGLFLARLWPNRCYGSNCSIMATSAMSGIATWSWHPGMFGATVFGFVQALGWCKWMRSWWIKFYSFSWVWSWRNVKIQIHPIFFWKIAGSSFWGALCLSVDYHSNCVSVGT